jgi:hypothetical protein
MAQCSGCEPIKLEETVTKKLAAIAAAAIPISGDAADREIEIDFNGDLSASPST